MIDKSSPAYIKTKSDADKAMQEISNNLNNILAKLTIDSVDELEEVGNDILNRSNDIAPKETRELVESGYVATEVEGSKATVEIGYTDPKSVYQHELYGTSYKNPTTPGTQPKFLQTAANEVQNEIAERVAKRLRGEIK